MTVMYMPVYCIDLRQCTMAPSDSRNSQYPTGTRVFSRYHSALDKGSVTNNI